MEIKLPTDMTLVVPLILGTIIAYAIMPRVMNFFAKILLKYPTIIIVYSFVIVEFCLYVAIRLFIRTSEYVFTKPAHRRINKSMKSAKSYNEWYELANELDKSQGRHKWQADVNDFTAKEYSWDYIQELISDMKAARANNDIETVFSVLQDCSQRNRFGTMCESLYSYTNTGEPKVIVTEFYNEIATTLEWITKKSLSSKQYSSRLHNFLTHATTMYGRTALCLSGGAMMGLYHFGTIKALLEEDILPNIFSGSSAGAMISAFTCTRTDEELRRDLNPVTVQPHFSCNRVGIVQRFLTTGYMFDNNDWLELIQWHTCGNLTFAEAYKKTGRILNISVSAKLKKAPPVVLNYISAPNVVIASAVVASASMVGILKPMNLRAKDELTGEIYMMKEEYWDGSIDQDIPFQGLGQMLNCHFFITAQVNPHIVPMVFNAHGSIGRPNTGNLSRRGGYLLSGVELYIKMDMRNKLNFLKEVGAVDGFTANLFNQDFRGSTMIVPDVGLIDYIKLVEDPTVPHCKRCFQGGAVTTYRNIPLIKLHYKIARVLDECNKKLKGAALPSQTSVRFVSEKGNEEEEDTFPEISAPPSYPTLEQNGENNGKYKTRGPRFRNTILKGSFASRAYA